MRNKIKMKRVQKVDTFSTKQNLKVTLIPLGKNSIKQSENHQYFQE